MSAQLRQRVHKTTAWGLAVLLVLLVFSSVAVAAPDWTVVGTAGLPGDSVYWYNGVPRDIACDSSGTPYIAFPDEGTANVGPTVMMFDGVNWQVVGSRGITGSSSADVALAFAPDDTPYIAFRDTGSANKATVMKFDGVNWVAVGSPGFSAYAIESADLAIDASGTPYVSFNTVNGFDLDLCVMKFDGTNWVDVGSSPFSTDDQPYDPTLTLSSTGVPYVAVRDQTDTTSPSTYKISVLTFNGATWEFVGDRRFSANYCSTPYIALNSYDTPYVIYSDDVMTYNGEATVMRYNGATWMAAGSVRFSTGEAEYPRLAFDMSDTPYALFADGGYTYKTVVQRLNGSTWEIVGSPGFSGGRAYGCAMAVCGNSIYAAYTDASQGYNATVMEYEAGGPLYAPIPVITEQPADVQCVEDEYVVLNIAATVPSGTLSYQWYESADGSTCGGTLLTGETGTTFVVPTDTNGTYYYYCIVTNTDPTATEVQERSLNSRAAQVDVTDAPTVTPYPSPTVPITPTTPITPTVVITPEPVPAAGVADEGVPIAGLTLIGIGFTAGVVLKLRRRREQ